MDAIQLISQDLFDKIRGRFSNLQMGDEDGNVTSDPLEARFFDFDFEIEGNILGRVSVSINERGSLKVFYGQGILDNTGPLIQRSWFDFLKEMRNFAKRRLLRFDTRDITKSNLNKTDFQYLASTGSKEDNMSESKMFGSSKSSYLPLEKTRLIIRHNRAVDETQRGARSRNINALYIENAEGERFKYPFIHLAGAKAMQRHVANGGRPYDECGQSIIKMSEQIAQLNAFKKHVGKHDSMHADANQILETACMKLESLRNQLHSLSKQHHYAAWKEQFVPDPAEDMVMDQATMEDYKSKFTVSTFSEDLMQYFPLIHSIMREVGEVDLDKYVGEAKVCDKCHKSPCECDDDCGCGTTPCSCDSTVKEFAEFEHWANALAEGVLTPDVFESLKQLMAGELTLGVDANDAIESLRGIGIEQSDLESALSELAKVNPDADPKPTIMAWLSKVDPESAKSLTTPQSAEAPAEDMEEMSAEPAEPSLLDIAKMVKSFYDRETKKFPLGKTGVVTKVRKELGDRAGDLAEKLVEKLEGCMDEGSSDIPKSNTTDNKPFDYDEWKNSSKARALPGHGPNGKIKQMYDKFDKPVEKQNKTAEGLDIILKLSGVKK